MFSFIEESDDLAVIGAQQADGFVDHGMPGFCFNGIGFKVGFVVFELDMGSFIIQRGDIGLLFSQKGQAAGADDGVEPGAEFGFASKVGQSAIGFYEYVLADLFGVFAVVGEPENEREDVLLIFFHQHGKKGLLALQDSRNDLGISKAGL